jgi:hypothetical protein
MTATEPTLQPPVPADQRPANRTPDFKAVLSVLLCGVLATMLNSSRLVEVAERLEFGPDRDRWLGAALVIDEAASDLYLDKPAEFSDALIDSDAPETQVVIGELATTTTTVPSRLALGTVEDDAPDGEPEEEQPVTSELTAPEITIPVRPTPPPLRTITDAQPLRVWVGGDSLGQFIGGDLKNSFADRQLSSVADDYNISTGLTRPDYFDWPARLTQEMSQAPSRPEALVLMLGGNDDQAMRSNDTTIVEPLTDAWADEYRSRVATVMDVSAYSGTRLFWINLPPMRDQIRNQITAVINEIVFDEAAARSWVQVINIIPLFTSQDGTYTDQLADKNGNLRKARAADGVHLTATSSNWVAELVWESVSAAWELH